MARPRPHGASQRVLTTDPGMGIARHADAGYPEAIAAAQAHGCQDSDAQTGRVTAPGLEIFVPHGELTITNLNEKNRHKI